MVTNTTPIKDMTRNELKSLMRDLLQELLWELEQQQPDPDEGLTLTPEFEAIVREAVQNPNRRGIPHDQLMKELGLDE